MTVVLLAATLGLVSGLELGSGCGQETTAVPAPTELDAACVALPQTCGDTVDCVVETRSDGTRACTGTSCCQDFCQLNGCDECCATTR